MVKNPAQLNPDHGRFLNRHARTKHWYFSKIFPMATFATAPAARQPGGADDPILSNARIAALQPDQMEVLLRQPHGAGIPIATASMRATPSGIPIPFPAVMAPLQTRFPAIDPVHFRDILENCFRPGNIVKRSAASRLQETAAFNSHRREGPGIIRLQALCWPHTALEHLHTSSPPLLPPRDL